ncbi:hypothetical protein D6829_01705 [Candidatus Pacearchaeota archaeon]|nr:MAG: hypothetical protein D6829_01705 [Candidatus Pacearchaeota archaeon]
MEDIIKEKISADHLLYVSLKYTKTCDVILNLISRWKSLIETAFDSLLREGVERGFVPHKPISPKQRIEFIKKYYSKYPQIQEVIPLYIFFKRIPDLEKSREGEFRKNVNLKVYEKNKETNINMEKLGEYAEIINEFVAATKEILYNKR